jgi:HAD superfamily hydrolase (TIGR01549 family)
MPVPPGSAVLPERIEAVVLDVGETLVDETRAWSLLADAAGLTRLTLFAALGALIERGEDHRKVWDLLTTSRPEIVCPIEEGDFYPDALDCIRRLSGAGYRVGLAGNQPVEAETALAGLGLPVSFVASSARWGVEKPSPGFFRRVAAEANRPPEHIAYVGDRLDNDVLPARAAGMWAVFLRRGPWGHLHGSRPEASWADARIDALSELLPAPPRADRTCVDPLIVGVHGLWTACRLRCPAPWSRAHLGRAPLWRPDHGGYEWPDGPRRDAESTRAVASRVADDLSLSRF